MPPNKRFANRCLAWRLVRAVWFLVFAKPTVKLVKSAQKLILLIMPCSFPCPVVVVKPVVSIPNYSECVNYYLYYLEWRPNSLAGRPSIPVATKARSPVAWTTRLALVDARDLGQWTVGCGQLTRMVWHRGRGAHHQLGGELPMQNRGASL